MPWRGWSGNSAIGHAFIAAVGAMPGQGVSGVFSFGESYGVMIGVLAALGLPMPFVAPAVWKRALQLAASKSTCISAIAGSGALAAGEA